MPLELPIRATTSHQKTACATSFGHALGTAEGPAALRMSVAEESLDARCPHSQHSLAGAPRPHSGVVPIGVFDLEVLKRRCTTDKDQPGRTTGKVARIVSHCRLCPTRAVDDRTAT